MQDNYLVNHNYALWLESFISRIKKSYPSKLSLLLHACCAPCSSYVLEYLASCFDITLLFYNPNISPRSEYDFRAQELSSLIGKMPLPASVELITADYTPEDFLTVSAGLEALPEGGERCKGCYRLRLAKAADVAKEGGFDLFSTTLSISPYKNARWLNEIGKAEGERVGVDYLFSDFKKNNGYKRSCELSREYGLYRQNYCGCEFSRSAAEKKAGD